MRYAKNTDRGECMSTMNLVVDGVPANKWEWAKYNFYPKNDMVGEVMLVRGFNVLKIMEGIYVPMSPLGIVEISADEYERGKGNLFSTVSIIWLVSLKAEVVRGGKREFTLRPHYLN